MAQKFENEVLILIKARDESEKTFGRVSERTRKFARDIEKNQKGAADQLAGIFKAVGFVEGGFKSLAIATEAWNGDLDKAVELAKSLPFGLGAAFTAGEQLGNALFGVNKELAESNRLTEEQSRRNKVLETQAKTRQAGLKTLASLNERLLVARASGFDKQRVRLEIDRQKAISEINKNAEKDRSDVSEKIRRESLKKIAELHHFNLLEIAIAETSAERAAADAASKQAAEDAAMVKSKADALRQGELSDQQALEQAKSDTRRLALEAQGRDLEAQQEMIKQNFRVRIREAEEAGRAEVAIELKTQRDLKLFAAQKEDTDLDSSGPSGAQVREQQSRFLTGVPEAATQFGSIDPVVEEQKQTNAMLAKLGSEMEALNKNLTKNPPLQLASGTASGA